MVDSVQVFSPGFQVLDPATGDPSSGAKILFFDAGTSTPRTVHSDSGLSTSLGTTITCNSNGVPVNGSNAEVEIYVANTAYKVEITTSADVTLYGPLDNVLGALDTSAFAAAGTTSTYQRPVQTESADFSVVVGDAGDLFLLNPSSATFTLTLPNAVTVGDGFSIGIRHIGTANQVRIATVSSQTIDVPGKNNVTAFSLTSIGHGGDLISDGANWVFANVSQPFGAAPFVIADRLSTPPGSPTPGARYIVTSSPTGDWSGFSEHDIAEADGQGNWVNYTPPTDSGWRAYVQDEDDNYQHQASAWVQSEGYARSEQVTWQFVEAQTASSSSEITFTDLDSTHYKYRVELDHVLPATDAVNFFLRTSTDNGTSYDSGASDYDWIYHRHAAASDDSTGSAADSEIPLFNGGNMGNAATEGTTGHVEILNPSGTNRTRVEWKIFFKNTAGTSQMVHGFGERAADADVDAIRFFFSSGAIASGEFTLYRIRAS